MGGNINVKTGSPDLFTQEELIGSFYVRYEQLMGGEAFLAAHVETVNTPNEILRLPMIGGYGRMREFKGERQANRFSGYRFEIRSKHWEYTQEVEKIDLRRDRTGQLNKRLGEIASVPVNELVFMGTDMLVNGHQSDSLCYDGKPFFSTTHSWGTSGSISNDVTKTEVPALQVVDPSNPTANEYADIILGLIQHQLNYKTDKGIPMNQSAKSFDIVVPVAHFGAAETAVRAKLLNSGTGSRDNPLASGKLAINVLVNPLLTDATQVYCMRTDAETKSLILHEEQPTSIDTLWLDSEYAKLNNHVLVLLENRRNLGYGLWQNVTRGTLSV